MASHDSPQVDQGVTRRTFLGASLASGAALVTGRFTSPFAAAFGDDDDAPWIEATIPQLQSLMVSGELTSRGLTRACLRGTAGVNPAPARAIGPNPDASAIAARL